MAFVDWVSFKWKGDVFATGRNRKICNWHQDQNFDSGRGLPWGTRTRSCGIGSGWHYCSQALWCRLLFWNTGMAYAAVASGNWSFQSSLQQGYAILAACPTRTMQFPSASPSSNVDIPMNYLSLTHLWRIPGLLLLLCARHLQLRQWFAWCAIFTLLCFLLHLLRRRALIYFSAGFIQPKKVSLLLLAFRQWNWLRRSFGLSRATDQSGLPKIFPNTTQHNDHEMWNQRSEKPDLPQHKILNHFFGRLVATYNCAASPFLLYTIRLCCRDLCSNGPNSRHGWTVVALCF